MTTIAKPAMVTASLFLLASATALAEDTRLNARVFDSSAELFFGRIDKARAAETPYQALIRQAKVAIYAANWEEAYTRLNQAIAMDPDLPDAYVTYHMAMVIRHEYAGAERALLKAVEVAPESAQVWYHYSRLMRLKGDDSTCLEAAAKAVALSAEKPDWRFAYHLADLRRTLGDPAGAIASLEDALRTARAQLSELDNLIRHLELQPTITNINERTELYNNLGGQIIEVPVLDLETTPGLAPEAYYAARISLRETVSMIERELVEARR